MNDMNNGIFEEAQKIVTEKFTVQVTEKGPDIDWTGINPGITYNGKAITLPADPGNMPIDAAMEALERYRKDELEPHTVVEYIKAFPTEAILAVHMALAELCGWASAVPIPGWFGPTPPKMVTVKTGPSEGDVQQVVFGNFKLPGIKEPINISVDEDEDGHPCIRLTGTMIKSEQATLLKIAMYARLILKKISIYKGKALHLPIVKDNLSLTNPPTFLDFSNSPELILPDDIDLAVQANIMALIRRTDLARKHKIPLKRGVLLYGPYGTGKTLIANRTAIECVKHGWTFLTIDSAVGLEEALKFAKRYQPCVVFVEDIDRQTGDRNDLTNSIMNTIDGITSKSDQIMVVMTTNHIDKINQGLLRPGRLDAVIEIGTPDRKAVEKLIRTYAGHALDPNASINRVADILAGNIPAVIREAVERAKLYASLEANGVIRITEDNLIASARSMAQHIKLLNADKKPEGREVQFFELLKELLGVENLGNTMNSVATIESDVDDIDSRTRDIKQTANATLSVSSEVRNGLERQAPIHNETLQNTQKLLKR